MGTEIHAREKIVEIFGDKNDVLGCRREVKHKNRRPLTEVYVTFSSRLQGTECHGRSSCNSCIHPPKSVPHDTAVSATFEPKSLACAEHTHTLDEIVGRDQKGDGKISCYQLLRRDQVHLVRQIRGEYRQDTYTGSCANPEAGIEYCCWPRDMQFQRRPCRYIVTRQEIG